MRFCIFTGIRKLIKNRISFLIILIIISLFGGITQYFAYNNMNQSFGSLNLGVFIFPFIIGWILFVLVQFVNLKWIRQYKWFWIAISIFLVLITMHNGISINGIKNWLSFGWFNINSGIWSMFFYALFLVSLKVEKAKTSSIKSKTDYRINSSIETILSAALLFLLLFYNEKQIFFAVFTIIFIYLLIIIKKKWVLIIFVASISIFITTIFVSTSYRSLRIHEYLNEYIADSKAYQAKACLKSFQIGGWTGIGFQPSKRIENNKFLLPLPTTYTTYSVVIEQFGIVGGIIVVLLFCYFIYFGLMVYKKNKENSEAFIILLLISIFILFNSVHILNCLGALPFGSILSFFSMGRDWNNISMILAGLIFKVLDE